MRPGLAVDSADGMPARHLQIDQLPKTSGRYMLRAWVSSVTVSSTVPSRSSSISSNTIPEIV